MAKKKKQGKKREGVIVANPMDENSDEESSKSSGSSKASKEGKDIKNKSKKESKNPKNVLGLTEEELEARRIAGEQLEAVRTIQMYWRYRKAKHEALADADKIQFHKRLMLWFFILVNALVVVAGLAIVITIYLYRIREEPERTTNWVLLLVGSVVVASSILGFIGAVTWNIKLLKMYAFALLLVMCAELSVAGIIADNTTEHGKLFVDEQIKQFRGECTNPTMSCVLLIG